MPRPQASLVSMFSTARPLYLSLAPLAPLRALPRCCFAGGGPCLHQGACPGTLVGRTPGRSPGRQPGSRTAAAERRARRSTRSGWAGGFPARGRDEEGRIDDGSCFRAAFRRGPAGGDTEGSGSEWSVQLVAANAQPIEKGDAILATFHLRAPTPPEGAPLGQTEFVFELGRAPTTSRSSIRFRRAANGPRFTIRFTAAQAYARGEAHMIFRLGYHPETIEIGGATVVSFGKHPADGAAQHASADRQRERVAAAVVDAAEEAAAKADPTAAGELVVSVAPDKLIRPISPYVYGITHSGPRIRGDVAPPGRQPRDRLQLGEQCLERRERLSPQQRRVVMHGARVP